MAMGGRSGGYACSFETNETLPKHRWFLYRYVSSGIRKLILCACDSACFAIGTYTVYTKYTFGTRLIFKHHFDFPPHFQKLVTAQVCLIV